MKAGTILTKAAAIVEGSRQQTHGEKERNFESIATMWNAYLRMRGITTCRMIEAPDVGHMMVLLKMVRACEGEPNFDHWLDMAGYAAISGEIATDEEVRAMQPWTTEMHDEPDV